MSLSMSIPEEVVFDFSMSMPKMEVVEFEQFEAEFRSSISMSMSLPENHSGEDKEETFQEFENIEETGVSLSMSMAIKEDVLEFEQFGVGFDYSMSMSIGEEAEFELFEDENMHSFSMSMPSSEVLDFEQFGAPFESLSMSVPNEEAFERFEDDLEISISMSMPELEEPELKQFESGIEVSEKTTNDDFFFMPIFDDQSDQMEPETIEKSDKDLLSISMSMAEDLAQWSVEGDFNFLEIDELSLSVSMSMA